MFRIIQIDPENLSININAGALSAHPKSEIFFAFLDLVSSYDIDRALEITTRLYGEDLDLLQFCSAYLHELRHFGDLILSPFGFYRIRTAFEFYVNFPALLWSSHELIPIPLMSGMDPVVRSVIGLGDEFTQSVFHDLGRTALSRRNVINRQNHFDASRGELYVGGDRILEGLAYVTQFEFIFNMFDFTTGRNYFPEFYSGFSGTKFDLAYRWFTPAVHELHPNEKLPNNRLIYSIMFASLCGHIPVLAKPRYKGAPPDKIADRDIGESLPSTRYFKLINHFKKSPRPSLSSDHEAYFIVDKACEDLFGKSLLSEIKQDIDYTDDIVKSARLAFADGPPEIKRFDMSQCLGTLNEYRRKIYERVERDPSLVFSSSNFSKDASKLLKPSLIYNYPQGLDAPTAPRSAVRKKWIGLIDRTLRPPSVLQPSLGEEVNVIYSYWSPRPGELGYAKGIEDTRIIPQHSVLDDSTLSAFQILYGVFSPVYRWILFGNKYQTMLEVENDNIPSALGISNDRIVYDSIYQSTNDITNCRNFHGFFRRNKYLCDICGNEVSPEASFIVSSRTIKQNKAIVDHYVGLGEGMYYLSIEKDWSDWLLCIEDMKKWDLPVPSDE